jgi:hypothetical protein
MVMSRVELGTKNRCAGEGQNKFSSQSVSELYYCCHAISGYHNNELFECSHVHECML